MSDIVPDTVIANLVGIERHAIDHYGRAVSAEQTVYILHSQQCKDTTPDLRDCPYSRALDRGIAGPVPWPAWQHVQDRPTQLALSFGWLVPAGPNQQEGSGSWPLS
ncbi:hypothetical protein [Kribbella sp. CA-293567]|uniref:hypothetical protein n=1 Tax=Kribbella sp. CA-293567 TaxID=3002436 RepID=UPI0022DD7ABE|nr:hypothetical protein [Kribbella sp. CA-293567]WBQ02996.1 hypothetical protein OX958_23800 [Kribbella sp. CA-293567]